MSTDIVKDFIGPRFRLRYSPASPFARKVRVAAAELGLSGRIELAACDVWAPGSDIAADNPLGKVPALVTDDGTFIGSTLCCEYLDSLQGAPRLVPAATADRWRVLRQHALADGIMEAAVAHVTEELRRPPQFVYGEFLERQRIKIRSALDVVESHADALGGRVDLATITLGCALGYLDFRLPQFDWRRDRGGLARWYELMAARPSMIATRPLI
jgi:glutathione S-transferase